ncbi:MAG: type III PLP-dependent enzyme [bacterium]
MQALLDAVARDVGTPCYVYLPDIWQARIAALRAAFAGRFAVSYAVKANPNPGILRRLRGQVDGLDVSSGGEIARALETGWDAARLSFTGPGKSAEELQYALDARIGEVIVESLDEATTLNTLAARSGRRQAVLARLAPLRVPKGFGLNMSGKPTQFGFDEETLDRTLPALLALPHLELIGLHIYSGTQCLSAAAIGENYAIFVELFGAVCRAHRLQPRKLVFGAGIGIPYHEGETAPELAAIAAASRPALDAVAAEPALAGAELVLESGRFLIGEAGVYLTRVIRTKEARGATLCICDGGMNHHLAASGHFGSVLQRNYRMFKLGGSGVPPAAGTEYTLVGPLCTTIDTIGRRVRFDTLAAGDVIGVLSSGAYGVTASPIHFISHRPPREVIAEQVDGRVHIEDCSQFVAPPWRVP